ncbi:hypothetical protein ABKN59_007460 [Abortiporus biennis]
MTTLGVEELLLFDKLDAQYSIALYSIVDVLPDLKKRMDDQLWSTKHREEIKNLKPSHIRRCSLCFHKRSIKQLKERNGEAMCRDICDVVFYSLLNHPMHTYLGPRATREFQKSFAMCARAQSEYKLTFRTDYWMSNDWRNTRYIIDELKGMLEASTANMDFSSPYLLYISTIRRLLAQLCIQVGCHSIVEWSLAKHGKLVNIKELINPVRLWHKVYMGDYIVKVKDSADDETSTKLYGVILKMPRQKSRDIRELSNITEREQALIYELLIWAKQQNIKFDFEQATVRWRLHILEGVQYLHSQGIIHGDLHGGNVLVTDDLHSVVLTDFGLSLVVGQFNNSLSARGGRQPFKAPELLNPIRFGLRESYRATEECDIYSFALVCIELYTLDDPFQPLYPNGQMPREIEFATLVIDKKLRPPKPRHHASHALVMGNGIWKLVTKCWETNPDKRLTIKELLESPGIWEF